MIIDGRKIAQNLISQLKNKPRPTKFLAAVLVGDNASSLSFIKQKEKTAQELNIDFKIYKFPATTHGKRLSKEILKITAQENCGGIILQLPFPNQINRDKIIKLIPPQKDVDNLTGRALVSSPAVLVLEEIIRSLKLEIKNCQVAVIGRGLLVGKPIARWLKNKVAHIAVYDSTSQDLKNKLKSADIVISGVGRAGLFRAADVKNGAFIIDFGYDMKDGKLAGDFDTEANEANKLKTISYTPTPGGTGPILVAKLFENFYKLNP